MTTLNKENIILTTPLDNGRAGNKLWQIAMCYATAYQLAEQLKETITVSLPYNEILNYFPELQNKENKAANEINPTHIYREQNFHYEKFELEKCHEVIKVGSQTIISIQGYFQSPTYHGDEMCRNMVLRCLEFSEELLCSCQKKLDNIRIAEVYKLPFTSIHFRFGDYVNNPYYFNLPASDYYVNAIEKMCDKTSGTIFLVFSDDKDLARKAMKFVESKMGHGIIYYIIDGTSDIEDLCMQSLCSHNICANSSFSYWSAMLNKNKNKVVTMPLNWFANDGLKNNTKDLYPEFATKI